MAMAASACCRRVWPVLVCPAATTRSPALALARCAASKDSCRMWDDVVVKGWSIVCEVWKCRPHHRRRGTSCQDRWQLLKATLSRGAPPRL